MIKTLLLLVTLVFTISSANVVTKTTVKTAEGIGIGINREEAVNNAIVEALSQINGSYISKSSFATAATINSTKGNSAAYVYSNKIKKITKGKVDSYSILDVINHTNGKYEATVRVKKIKKRKYYKTPGLNHKKRRSIVIVPANLNSGYFNIMGSSKSSVKTNINLSQELLNKVTQTRKFNVLDREENRAFYNEQKIFKSRDAHKNEALKLGNVLGADYILLTSIKDLNVNKEKGSAYITNSSSSYKATTTIQFKVITTATRQVKFANTRNYSFEPNGNTNKQIYYDILAKISSRITTELIENIYPIKVIQLSGDIVTLNQGNMQVGKKFEVYKLGEILVDSYTKESLGRSESKTGVVTITKAMPKYSLGKIDKGEASKGSIIRSLYNSKTNNKESMIYKKIGRESNVEINNDGGVSLPFD